MEEALVKSDDCPRPLVSCVIPAFNEEERINRVIQPCLDSGLLEEVIVVNDGSKDGTKQILENFKGKIKIVNLPHNRGKGFAVVKGVKEAKGEIILLLDADLVGLQFHHIRSLIAPVSEQDVDMTIGAFVDFKKPYYYGWPFSGQRAIKRKLLTPSVLKEIVETRYGIEIVLNERFKNEKIMVVPLVNLGFIKKTGKREDWFSAYLKMNLELAQLILEYKGKKLKEKIFNKLLKDYFTDRK